MECHYCQSDNITRKLKLHLPYGKYKIIYVCGDCTQMNQGDSNDYGLPAETILGNPD